MAAPAVVASLHEKRLGQVVTKAEASDRQGRGWTAGGELAVGMRCQGLASTGTPQEYGSSSVVVVGR